MRKFAEGYSENRIRLWMLHVWSSVLVMWHAQASSFVLVKWYVHASSPVKVAIHYVWCVICMRDARNSRIKWRIPNHQQIRVYTLFAVCSFPVNKLSVHFQKSVNANFSFGDARSYRLEERSCTSQCACRSKSTSIHDAQFTNFWRFRA